MSYDISGISDSPLADLRFRLASPSLRQYHHSSPNDSLVPHTPAFHYNLSYLDQSVPGTPVERHRQSRLISPVTPVSYIVQSEGDSLFRATSTPVSRNGINSIEQLQNVPVTPCATTKNSAIQTSPFPDFLLNSRQSSTQKSEVFSLSCSHNTGDTSSDQLVPGTPAGLNTECHSQQSHQTPKVNNSRDESVEMVIEQERFVEDPDSQVQVKNSNIRRRRRLFEEHSFNRESPINQNNSSCNSHLFTNINNPSSSKNSNLTKGKQEDLLNANLSPCLTRSKKHDNRYLEDNLNKIFSKKSKVLKHVKNNQISENSMAIKQSCSSMNQYQSFILKKSNTNMSVYATNHSKRQAKTDNSKKIVVSTSVESLSQNSNASSSVEPALLINQSETDDRFVSQNVKSLSSQDYYTNQSSIPCNKLSQSPELLLFDGDQIFI